MITTAFHTPLTPPPPRPLDAPPRPIRGKVRESASAAFGLSFLIKPKTHEPGEPPLSVLASLNTMPGEPSASRMHRSNRHHKRQGYGPLRLASVQPCDDEVVPV